MVSVSDVTTRTVIELLTAKGLVNIASHRFTGVAQGEVREVVVQNPATESGTLFIALTAVNSQGLLDVDILENVTIDTPGTDVNVENLTIGEPVESDIEVEFGGDYSGGDQHSEDVAPGGAGGPGGSGSVAGSALGSLTGITLNENQNVMYQFTNRSTSTIRFAVKLITTESSDKLVTP